MSHRETLQDGSVRMFDQRGSFLFSRPRPGVVVVTFSGKDDGQFGTAPLDELAADLARYAPVELFIDAQPDVGANLRVQRAWTEFFARHRSQLKSVNVLVRSKYMHVTVELARFFSRTGELIRVYLDDSAYQEAISRVAPR